MTDIDSTSSYGGARVDEMLPAADMARLMQKLTPPKRTGRSRLRRAGLTASKVNDSAKKRKTA